MDMGSKLCRKRQMSIHLEVHPATTSSILPIVQMAITAFSVMVALASALITRQNYLSGRRDRIQSRMEEIGVAVSEAWKLSQATERAQRAFDPMITLAERERFHSSAMGEIAAVVAKLQWPVEVDRVHIDLRRLLEDTAPASSQTQLSAAAGQLQPFRDKIDTAAVVLGDRYTKLEAELKKAPNKAKQ